MASTRPKIYVDKLLDAIDAYIRDNLDTLTARELADYYNTLLERLKTVFGGSWGLHGATEILIHRALYHIARAKYGAEPTPLQLTRDIRGFLIPGTSLVLAAGAPFQPPSGKKIWIDITVRRITENTEPARWPIHSALEVKAYPSSAEAVLNDAKRLHKVARLNPGAKTALIIYQYPVKNPERSKLHQLLAGGHVPGYPPIPSSVEVILPYQRETSPSGTSYGATCREPMSHPYPCIDDLDNSNPGAAVMP